MALSLREAEDKCLVSRDRRAELLVRRDDLETRRVQRDPFHRRRGPGVVAVRLLALLGVDGVGGDVDGRHEAGVARRGGRRVPAAGVELPAAHSGVRKAVVDVPLEAVGKVTGSRVQEVDDAYQARGLQRHQEHAAAVAAAEAADQALIPLLGTEVSAAGHAQRAEQRADEPLHQVRLRVLEDAGCASDTAVGSAWQ